MTATDDLVIPTRAEPGRVGARPDDRIPRITVIAADLGLLALALGTAAAFTRLFVGWGFLAELAVPVVAAWGLASTLRHLNVRIAVALALHTLVGVVLLTVMFAPGTHLLGVPTPDTLDLLSTSVSESFSAFSRLVAPVETTDGFLVVIAAALWIFAFFADTAAFRYAGPVQAAVPYLSSFLATGILAREHGRVVASVCFIGGVVVYATTERALRAAGSRWVGRSGRRGSRATGAAAAVLGAVALIGGLALGPLLPGSAEPVVDLRDLGKGAGPRTVVSPFVGLRSMLGVRSNTEMFTVRSEQPAYWRLTALEEFDEDRDIWVSRTTYRRTDGPLTPDLDPDVPGTELRQDVAISGLAGLWLPGAYEPRDYEGSTEVSYDRESASIILREERGAEQIDYRLESFVPDLRAAENADAGSTDDLPEDYFTTPELSERTEQLLDEAVAGADTDYERALALQDWFRSEFAYDEAVDFRDDPDALEAFLESRRGFCQQFSSAFALMARSLGLPSRVAVGFTPGDPVQAEGADVEEDEVEYVVRGRHAHAWPEIYFDGVGWVPFEPTPGRGDPQSTERTGVPAEQAEPTPSQAATTTSTAVPTQGQTPSEPPTTLPGDVAAVPPSEADPADEAGGSGSWSWLVLLALAAVVVGGALVWRAGGPRRRVRHEAAGTGRIGDAWARSAGWLAVLGLTPAPSETPVEFAFRASEVLRRTQATLPPDTLPAADGTTSGTADDPSARAGDVLEVTRGLIDLAEVETGRRYSGMEPSAEVCERAEAVAAAVEQFVRADTTRRRRVEHRLKG